MESYRSEELGVRYFLNVGPAKVTSERYYPATVYFPGCCYWTWNERTEQEQIIYSFRNALLPFMRRALETFCVSQEIDIIHSRSTFRLGGDVVLAPSSAHIGGELDVGGIDGLFERLDELVSLIVRGMEQGFDAITNDLREDRSGDEGQPTGIFDFSDFNNGKLIVNCWCVLIDENERDRESGRRTPEIVESFPECIRSAALHEPDLTLLDRLFRERYVPSRTGVLRLFEQFKRAFDICANARLVRTGVIMNELKRIIALCGEQDQLIRELNADFYYRRFLRAEETIRQLERQGDYAAAEARRARLQSQRPEFVGLQSYLANELEQSRRDVSNSLETVLVWMDEQASST